MFCPTCANEYRPGIDLCSTCGVALVDEQYVKAAGHDKPFVRVFGTTNQLEFDLVKGFLRAHGIPFVTTGDASAPFGSEIQTNSRVGWESAGSQLFVPPSYADQTKMILANAAKKN